MRRFWIHISLALLCFTAKAQNSLSFYHLGNATFQNSYYNPALIPEGKVFIGLPILSGIHLNYNNKFSYSDIIVKGEFQNEIDLNLYLKSLQKNNMLSVSSAFNLFHIAFTSSSGATIALYANERIEMDFLYSKSLMEFAINGNATLTGEKIEIGKTRLSATHFREIGIGYTTRLTDDLSVGVRAKYLQGFLNASTPGDFTADLTTNEEDYSLSLDLQNATLRTSGLGIYQGNTGDMATHLISNNNRGGALDFGFNWNMDRNNTISGSLVDLGFISWKDDIKNHTLEDTTMTYSGIDLKDPDNLEETIKDSLINKFKDRKTETFDPYSTMLAPKLYLSWAYRTPLGGDIIATSGTRYVQGQFKFLVGAGYRHTFGKFFVGTFNVTRLPQQFLNLGGALAIKGGPAQMYLAVDQMVNYDLTKFQSIDFRFGVNFIIGRREPESLLSKSSPPRSKRTKANSQSFLGSKVKVKGQEGIYTIIEKQDRRKKKDFDVQGDPVPKVSNPKTEIQSVKDPIPKEGNRFKKRKPKKDF